jgi:ABC transporter permease protein
MPETQRARIAEIFKRVLSKMEATQNIFTSNANNTGPDGKICVIDPKKYLADKKAGKLEDLTNRKSYFAYMSGNGIDSSDDAKNKKFKFVE